MVCEACVFFSLQLQNFELSLVQDSVLERQSLMRVKKDRIHDLHSWHHFRLSCCGVAFVFHVVVSLLLHLLAGEERTVAVAGRASTQYFETATGFWEGGSQWLRHDFTSMWACQGDELGDGFAQLGEGQLSTFLFCAFDAV